jgi:hypothetical protein
MKKMERKCFDDLSRMEKICLYLHDHPEALTERLMTQVAARIMNYGYIRLRIRELYKDIILENIKNKNFVLVPDHYVEK